MKKVAIFMSDFHLGQGNRMEEFHVDKEFAELLGRLSEEHAEDEVDLVLLGDVMDLWTTVTSEKEENAETPDDVDLYLPVDDPQNKNEVNDAEDKELDKAKEITKKHRVFFEAIGKFLVSNSEKRRVLYVPGNHDHSVVYEKLKDWIRDCLLTPGVQELFFMHNPTTDAALEETKIKTLKDRIQFPLYYRDDEQLLVYAEHGNQLTYGGIFRYWDREKKQSTFGVPGSECPGYVEFKLVSSRLERSAPELNGILMGAFNPANWPGLWWWLLFKGNFLTLGKLQKYLIQYENYKSERVSRARAATPPAWKTILNMLRTRIWGVTHDEFSDLVPQFFINTTEGVRPLCYRQDKPESAWLDPQRIKTLILGHSHQTRDVNLMLPGLNGGKYYNTGSWILRYENERKVVEQTWVSISLELPVRIKSINKSINKDEQSITIQEVWGSDEPHSEVKEGRLKISNTEVLGELKEGDSVYIEKDEEGSVTTIRKAPLGSTSESGHRSAGDPPGKIDYQRVVIDRQMIRRRVELAKVDDSPVTTDGQPLNPVMRAMTDLRVGDMVLFHWNFGAHLGRLLKERRIGEFFRVIPEMVKGAFNRLGTSSYWNHIAMVYGSPSEEREDECYNDPLIIEAVPEVGVSIHTPQHYLEHFRDWNLAVLRLQGPLLGKWEIRCLLRRLALGALEAQYDVGAIARQTIFYAARTMDAKGKSVVGGLVKGAIGGVVLCTLALLGIAVSFIYHNRTYWLPQVINWTNDLMPWLARQWFNQFAQYWAGNSSFDAVTCIYLVAKGLLYVLLIGIGLLYVVRRLLQLAWKSWLGLTAALGAIAGALIVPVMADFAEGWTKKSQAQRWSFTIVWFSPLLIVFPLEYMLLVMKMNGHMELMRVEKVVEATGIGQVIRVTIMAVLLSALITVLSAQFLSNFADRWTKHLKKLLNLARSLRQWVYKKFGWVVSEEPSCGKYALHKQFICSGLVQEALVETARAENVKDEAVIANMDDWNSAKSEAEKACVLKDTLPKHFALAKDQFNKDKFKWTYLFFDGVLTPNPSASHRAQAYTPPDEKPRTLSKLAGYSIKFGFAGLFLLILTTDVKNVYGFLLPFFTNPDGMLHSFLLPLLAIPKGVVNDALRVIAVFFLIATFWQYQRFRMQVSDERGAKTVQYAYAGFFLIIFAATTGFVERLLVTALACAIAAMWFHRCAVREIALKPKNLRGLTLSYYGLILGLFTLWFGLLFSLLYGGHAVGLLDKFTALLLSFIAVASAVLLIL